jgi:hypothetical protein
MKNSILSFLLMLPMLSFGQSVNQPVRFKCYMTNYVIEISARFCYSENVARPSRNSGMGVRWGMQDKNPATGIS